jgi:hypothetical protein
LVLVHDLDAELPLWTVAGLDGVPEILTVEVGVLAGQDLGFFPDERGLALLGLPVPLDELGGAVLGDQAEGVDAESVLGENGQRGLGVRITG